MQDYRLLFYKNGRLAKWETVEATNSVEAVRTLAGRGHDETVEVWQNDQKLAIVRPSHAKGWH